MTLHDDPHQHVCFCGVVWDCTEQECRQPNECEEHLDLLALVCVCEMERQFTEKERNRRA